MTTTAATWFYHQPEKIKYLLEERVRTSFWDARFGSFWANAVSTDNPIEMEGTFNGAPLQMVWEPGQWFRLSTHPAQPGLAKGLSNIILHRPVTLTYEDPQGHTVWEWRLADADKRWQEIQGKPAYRNLQRLDKAK